MNETVSVERMSYGPDAVGRLASGKTVFVPGAVPGDVVEVSVVEEKPTFARAALRAVVEPSVQRAKDWQAVCADAPLQAVAPWSQLSYDAQLAAKQDCVVSALTRTARLDAELVARVMSPIVAAPHEWGYRNKVELAATPDPQGRLSLGFHAPGSDRIVPAKECRLANHLLRKAPKALTGALRYLAGSGDLGIYRVGIRASERTGSVEVALWTPPSSFPRTFAAKMLRDAVGASSVVRVIADAGASRKVKRVEVLDGDGFWRERSSGFDFAVSAPSFFQVNTAQAELLVSKALEGAALGSGDVAADLFSGVGAFSLPMAAAGAEVVAVELEGSSSRDFRINADANGVDAEMVCDDVRLALPHLGPLDAVVVDPPRAGLHADVVASVADAGPQRVVYVSCDPQTLARDVARFAQAGYVLESVQPVDMFPQTYHVETVCALARG